MAEHIWTTVCHKYLVDPETNVISLIDVVEQLILHPINDSETVEQTLANVQSAGMKGAFFPVDMRLISHWTRSQWERPEEAKIRISFVDPKGEKLLEQEQTVLLTDFAAARLALRLDVLRVTVLGYYWFVVEREDNGQWEQTARVPLELRSGN